MGPTLYHVPGTISSPIYQAMIYIGADVTVETLSFGDLKTPEHLARNPMGTSPTLVDSEHSISIWESGAVLTYLLEQYDTTFRLSPRPGVASPADRAKFLHLQQYILATVYPFLASLYIHTLKPVEEQDSGYVELSISRWRTLLAPTLAKFLGESNYFMGNQEVGAVDFLVAKPLKNANSLGLLHEFPALHALYERIASMPSFAKAYDRQPTSSGGTENRGLVLTPIPDKVILL
jgi:glutathione S-transferase